MSDERNSSTIKWTFGPIATAPSNYRVLIYNHREMAMAWKDRIDGKWYYSPQGGLVQFEPEVWCNIPEPPL